MKCNAILVATATRFQEKETDSLVAVAMIELAKTNRQRCQQRRVIRRNLIVFIIVDGNSSYLIVIGI